MNKESSEIYIKGDFWDILKSHNILFYFKSDKYKGKNLGGPILMLEELKFYKYERVFSHVPTRGAFGRVTGFKKVYSHTNRIGYCYSKYRIKAELEDIVDMEFNANNIVPFPSSISIHESLPDNTEISHNRYDKFLNEFSKINRFDMSKWYDIDPNLNISTPSVSPVNYSKLGIYKVNNTYEQEYRKILLKIDCNTSVYVRMIRYKNIIGINLKSSYIFANESLAIEAFNAMKEHFESIDTLNSEITDTYFDEFQALIRDIIPYSEVYFCDYDKNDRITSISLKIKTLPNEYHINFKLPTYGDVYHKKANICGELVKNDISERIYHTEELSKYLRDIKKELENVK